jgi:hypothetical protein
VREVVPVMQVLYDRCAGNDVHKDQVTVAARLLVWQVLATGTPYTDLGPDFYTSRTDPAKETQRLIARLQALGHKVTIEPAAA